MPHSHRATERVRADRGRAGTVGARCPGRARRWSSLELPPLPELELPSAASNRALRLGASQQRGRSLASTRDVDGEALTTEHVAQDVFFGVWDGSARDAERRRQLGRECMQRNGSERGREELSLIHI